MLTLVVVGFVIILMGLAEIATLLWFLWVWRDYRHGKTIKKIPLIIPILYIGFNLLLSWMVFQMDTYFLSESIIPFEKRLMSALRVLAMLNLTTLLFPLLAWLKHRQIQSRLS
jgi:hypothetical protein